MSVLSCAKFLESVDLPLDGGAFTVETQPLHGPYTFVYVGRRRGRFGCNLGYQLGVYCT